MADWQLLTKSIFDWTAAASGAERSQRIEILNRLLQEVKVLANRFGQAEAANDQQAMEEIRKDIHKILHQYVEQTAAGK